MKNIFIIFLSLFLILPVQAKVKSKDIIFPKHFYTNQIEACSYVGSESFKSKYTKNRIESLIELDWMSEWAKGNSRSVNHKNLTGPIKLFAVATHTAVGNNDENEINSAKEVLVKIAKANVLMDTIVQRN